MAPDDEAGEAEETEPAAQKSAYEYEDSAVKVTATLESADAIPDDAEFKVTAVTPTVTGYNYDAYMEALNKDAGEEDAYTSENTLLYDIAFLAKDADGKIVEIQPASGSVKVQFEFKQEQLSEELNAEKAADVTVTHLSLKEEARDSFDTTADATTIDSSDIAVEGVSAELALGETEHAVFSAEDFSVWAWTNGAADQITIPEIEGTFANSPLNLIQGEFKEMHNFGLVGFNSITQNNHIHSNFATNNLIVNWSPGTIGRRKANKLGEAFYIGKSISGTQSTAQLEIYGPGSLVLVGDDLIDGGKIVGQPNDTTYHAVIGGVNYEVMTNTPAAQSKNGKYESPIFRHASASYLDLEGMKETAVGLSSDFADRPASGVTVRENYGGNQENVLVAEIGDQTLATMNFTASEVQGKVLQIDESHVDNTKHMLIINIDAAGSGGVTVPKVIMNNTSQTYTGEVQTWTSGNVVLNVYDSTKPDGLFRGTVAVNSGPTSASILAPEATVIANFNVNGEIIANDIVINEEFHRDSITFDQGIPSGPGGIRIAKTFNGSHIIPDTYQVKLESIDGAPMPAGSNNGTLIKDIGADGLVALGFMNFDTVGDYRYRVSEVIPDGATEIGHNQRYYNDVVYDTNSYVIEVHTVRNENGTIVIGSYTIYESDGKTEIRTLSYDEGKAGVVEFENSSLLAEVPIRAKKSFGGWLDEEFSFTLTPKTFVREGTNNPVAFDKKPSNGLTATATKTRPTANFGVFAINSDSELGTYTFSLQENCPADATVSEDGKTKTADGIVYDAVEHTVVIKAEKVNDKYHISVTYDGKKSLTVKNSREPLVVEKKWFNGDEDVTSSKTSGSVEYKLMRKYADAPKPSGSKTIHVYSGQYNPDEREAIEVKVGDTIVFTCEKGAPAFRMWPNGSNYYSGSQSISFDNPSANKYTFKVSDLDAIESNIGTLGTEGNQQYTVEHEPVVPVPKATQYPDDDTTFTVSAAEKWKAEHKNLPASGEVNGKNYLFTYYVEEVPVAGYDTAYENNEGVITGTIAIKNTRNSEPLDEAGDQAGDLKVTKTFGGDVTKEEVAKGAITFEVKTSDGKWLDKDGKVSDTKVELTLGEADGFKASEDGLSRASRPASTPSPSPTPRSRATSWSRPSPPSRPRAPLWPARPPRSSSRTSIRRSRTVRRSPTQRKRLVPRRGPRSAEVRCPRRAIRLPQLAWLPSA